VKKLVKLAFLFVFLVCLSACGPKLEKLPPKEMFASAFEAQRTLYEAGYSVIRVAGTGSMKPLIPEHRDGINVIVAYAGLDDTKFEELKPGMVVSYRAGPNLNYIHRLGQKTDRGFIAYGIANRQADSGFVTPYNFNGRVAKVHVFPLFD
jgi:hypothetical protein